VWPIGNVIAICFGTCPGEDTVFAGLTLYFNDDVSE
jgi:hypothetical protein